MNTKDDATFTHIRLLYKSSRIKTNGRNNSHKSMSDMALSGKRSDDCVARFTLVSLFFFCIVGFLLGIVFIYLNMNDRITRLEQKVFPEGSD